MIRRIKLVNFMSHANTVIEPADGLTILVGQNNCGKSAIVAASSNPQRKRDGRLHGPSWRANALSRLKLTMVT